MWPDDDDYDFDDPENVPGFEDPDELDRIIEEELGNPRRPRKSKKVTR